MLLPLSPLSLSLCSACLLSAVLCSLVSKYAPLSKTKSLINTHAPQSKSRSVSLTQLCGGLACTAPQPWPPRARTRYMDMQQRER